ncbi:MAG: endonuclease domain-containing protein [Actinomycetota bacterium]|nr:endonuclease domain-containing protein [Actinomycetota bacterium]
MREFDTSRRSAGPERLRQQIFRGSDAVAEGLISASRLRREYTRVLHDIYVPAGSKIDHGVRTLAALLRMSEAAVLTAHSAAWWYGVASAEPTAPVILILPRKLSLKGALGVRVHISDLADTETEVVDGLRLASPLRTAWDSATLTPPRCALATIDGLLRRNLMTQQQLLGHLVTRAGVWGVARARPVFELADGRSESPAESWTRWLLHSVSLPPFELQFEVFDEQSRFIARVDFAWPANKVALEYDGSYHSDPLQQAVDQRRNAALARLGWNVLHMTSSDLHDPHRTLMELRGLLAA